MVLAKMNNYEHRSKPIFASYTFQVLMSFCSHKYALYETESLAVEIALTFNDLVNAQGIFLIFRIFWGRLLDTSSRCY